jgi:hypothetical protein
VSLVPASSRPDPALHSSFLLPLCGCGGAMNLAALEPHPALPGYEIKTYRCQDCAAQEVFTVEARPVETNG